jgi:hypothetical protein
MDSGLRSARRSPGFLAGMTTILRDFRNEPLVSLIGVILAKGELVEPLQARIHLCDVKGEINDLWDSLTSCAASTVTFQS